MVEKTIKKFFIGLTIISTLTIYTVDDRLAMSKNYFQPRAFSANLAREMLMQASVDQQADGWFTDFSATAVYQRSWEQNTGIESNATATGNGLGTFPFWSGNNVMLVGSAQNFGVDFDVDSYQFGLGFVTTNGGVILKPIMYQTGADFMFVMGSSQTESGFFAKIKAPLGVCNLNPNLTEVPTTLPLDLQYPAGALEVSSNNPDLAASSMVQAFAGNLIDGQFVVGDFTPMQFGLLNGDQSTGVRFADIEMTAGYNFIFNHHAALSIGVRASAPTGNKATAEYMLEPIFGRGGYWGLGAYLAAHTHIWEGDDENFTIFKCMANALHLFSIDTVRSYDLTANGLGSKYLLVADYTDGIYGQSIQNLINLSTLSSQSSYAAEIDATFAFTYMHHGLNFDLGYEFFARSNEKLEITGNFPEASFAVLGNQAVGYDPGTGYIDLNACQPLAAMNILSTSTALSPSDITAGPATSQGQICDATDPINRISGNDALNIAGAQQSAYFTSKIFSQLSYQWRDSNYVPHLGLMAELEFSNCTNNALPQWSLALVGGLTF